ncbi:MAG: PIG-L family deacetylase [Bryobacteraceae bacterium]
MRILSVHAHPDDAEMLAGGTLARLAARGHNVTIATMTAGDCGSAEHWPEEIASIRQKEAQTAATLIGAAYECLHFRDMAIFNDDASRRRVTACLRRQHPDVVLTASPADYHCDHEATSVLVRDACFAAPARNYDTSAHGGGEPLGAIPHLYFMDSVDGGLDREGRPIRADFFVDVAAELPIKREMLARHESQRAWLKKHHGMDDYLETMETWTRSRGAAAGLVFAEGFRHYKGHPYPASPLLQELTGSHGE